MTENVDAPIEQGSHFWHMSFLTHNAIGLSAEERNGHWTPSPEMSRFDAMTEIRRQVVETNPYLVNAVMISFDMQPNRI
ncbi:hypothetical protein [Streptomyces tendae]|uniref:hypothetical protein n=1 Tax=Streptomyces tendae TaxID=1932 RepID=UPI00382AD1E9